MNIGSTNPGVGTFTALNTSGATGFTANVAATSTTSGTVVITGGLGVSGAIYAGTLEGTAIGGVSRSSGAFTTIDANGAVSLTSTAAATNNTTGALVVTGGVGIGGALFAGSIQNTAIGSTSRSSGAFTTLAANSTVGFTATTDASSNTAGAVIISGGVAVAKRVYAGGGFQGAIGNAATSTGQFTTITSSSTASFTGNTSVNGSSTFSVGTGTATFGGSVQMNGGAVGATSAFTPSSNYHLMTKIYSELQFGKPWAVQAANITATSGSRYFVNTTAGARTITLPASPSTGDWVQFVDYGSTFDTNALTVGRNAQRIMGIADDMTVNTEGAAFTLVFSGNATYGWRMASGI